VNMRLIPLIAVPFVARALTAQVDRSATPPNWVDTIKVERLPTGGCNWSTAARRMRPGNRGTTTRSGRIDEKTCTVLFLNYTTGSPTDTPSVEGFAFVEDHKYPVPPGAVLNFADTFTVARRPDGSCEWGRFPFRNGPPGSSSRLAEARTTTCWGVIHNLSGLSPSPASAAPLADTTTLISSVSGAAARPEAMQQIDGVVRKEFPSGERIHISNRRFKGDSAWVNVQHTPTSWTIFTLVWVNAGWKVTQRATSTR
jgi:hypothetical protein